MKKEKNTPAEETPAAVPEKAPVKEQPKERPAKVTKVGAMLKEMRLQKGLKTADIAKKLCIRKIYLEAIEDSNYKEIPPLPYGIGFIRSYANFLGLNGENIVELYKEETNLSEPQDIKVLEPQPEATMPGIQYLLISLLAIALIYIGWNLFSQKDDLSPEENLTSVQPDMSSSDSGVIIVEDFNFEPPAPEVEPVDTAEVVVPQPEEAAAPQITVSEGAYPAAENATPATTGEEVSAAAAVTEAPKAATEALEQNVQPAIPDKGVFIEVLKETWVEVKDESKLYLSKVLYKGDTYQVPEGKGMILSLGKYDGANVYINGVLTKVARPGKKTNIALDPLLDAQH